MSELESLPKWKDNQREYGRIWMRNWRNKNPERAKETRRGCMRKWRVRHKEEKNRRAKNWRAKWSGMPESQLKQNILQEFPRAISLDENTPDYFDDKSGAFVEVKRALPFKRCMWVYNSKHFPSLYFSKIARNSRTPTVDEQIKKYPKPLLVIVFHALTGEELARKYFGEGWVEVSEGE